MLPLIRPSDRVSIQHRRDAQFDLMRRVVAYIEHQVDRCPICGMIRTLDDIILHADDCDLARALRDVETDRAETGEIP